ncbi:phospholipase D family protein [Botryobacter ruber]|uniref:phospholipase D family protein n=1 Tax=Botryobacter ruber TaxID=2171629 RepID=UPI000E0A3CBE|nr:phospholipase D family protein [Botryobacter ruber]
MSKFITGKELSEAVDTIIWKAKEEILLVSPYIKLDAHFKELFEKQRHNHKLHILLIFGKNEGRVDKSFNKTDIDYFKQFPNISIIYVPNLHAKYYANEKMGVVTSINLYDYSFKNNIEFGVLYENKLLSKFTGNNDNEVWNTCKDLAEANAVVYINRPMYADYDDYRSSKVLLDLTEALYKGQAVPKSGKKLADFEDELDFDKVYSEMPTRQSEQKQTAAAYSPKPVAEKTFVPGYCIRTGVKIPFNPKAPLCHDAYKSWAQFKNEDFKEKYCHYSGEASNGETSVRRPILRKNWNKAH